MSPPTCGACGLPFLPGELRAVRPDGTAWHAHTQPNSMRRCRLAILASRPRTITTADRALAYADRLDRALDNPPKDRRRTHFRFGKLDVVVVEQAGEPTTVYLEEADSDVVVEATAAELAQAAAAVVDLLTNPPPTRKKR